MVTIMVETLWKSVEVTKLSKNIKEELRAPTQWTCAGLPRIFFSNCRDFPSADLPLQTALTIAELLPMIMGVRHHQHFELEQKVKTCPCLATAPVMALGVDLAGELRPPSGPLKPKKKHP